MKTILFRKTTDKYYDILVTFQSLGDKKYNFAILCNGLVSTRFQKTKLS